VTDAGVKAVADKLTGLTSLNLSSAKVTDAGVKAVADKLTALTSLNLTYCEKVTDAGVKAVADKLTSLTNLDVSGIPSLRIPKELLQPSNLAAIRAYYSRGEREGKRQLNEAKLIVVGNEAVGKIGPRQLPRGESAMYRLGQDGRGHHPRPHQRRQVGRGEGHRWRRTHCG
jgi:hypothetical protein